MSRREGASRALVAIVGIAALAVGFGLLVMFRAAWPTHLWRTH